jgi:predicted small metal-binding protein
MVRPNRLTGYKTLPVKRMERRAAFPRWIQRTVAVRRVRREPKEDIMRLFECGTLVPGCDWHTRAEEDAEVVRRAVDHLRTVHGETVIRENMVENIKGRIRSDKPAESSAALSPE